MKYLKLEVSREWLTEMYVEVPDDFETKAIHSTKYARAIDRLANHMHDGDWQSSALVEIMEVEEVDAAVAKQFTVGRLECGTS